MLQLVKRNHELIKCRHNLTIAERHAYIDAELCLMSSPPKTGLEGAKNRWDELHWVHVVQSNVIHGVVSKIDKWRVWKLIDTGRIPSVAPLLRAPTRTPLENRV